MSLIERIGNLSGPEVSNVPLDIFHSCLYELAKGHVTKAQIVAYFALNADEEAELDWLIGKYNAQPNATAKASFVEQIRVIFMLAESRVPGYVTQADLIARINAI